MKTLAGVALAAVLAGAGPQDEMVENPEYKGWVGQKVGAWVKYKSEWDAGGKKMESIAVFKLKELTPEKAVISPTTEMDMGGEKRTMDMPARNVPAKIKKGTDTEGSKVEILKEGEEEIEVKGTKYKCQWVDAKVTNKLGEMNIRVWRSDKIVGGAAKMTMKSDQGNMTMTAVDWKAGE